MDEKKQRYAALTYRDFRLFWGSLFVSNIGTQMQLVALTWHVYLLTHNPLSLGLIGLCRFVPLAIFSLVGGAVADAKNRKRIMYITQTCLIVFSAVLAGMTFLHHITPLIIYTMTFLSSVMLAFDGPARQAIVPSLVKREHFSNAISLNIIMYQTSLIIGPAIAGLLLGAFGVGIIYSLNAASFIAVISALLLMHATGDIAGDPAGVSFNAMREGLRFVKERKIILSTMLLDFIATLLGSATTLTPIFALDILKVPPFLGGLLYAAPSVGAVAAGFVLAQRGKMRNEGKVLLVSIAMYACATIVFGFSRIYLLSILALMVVGAGDSVSTVIRNTIRNLNTPDAFRGRVNSVSMIFQMGGPQLGEFEAGLAASVLGTPLSVAAGGIATLLAVGIIAFKAPLLRAYKNTVLEPIVET